MLPDQRQADLGSYWSPEHQIGPQHCAFISGGSSTMSNLSVCDSLHRQKHSPPKPADLPVQVGSVFITLVTRIVALKKQMCK